MPRGTLMAVFDSKCDVPIGSLLPRRCAAPAGCSASVVRLARAALRVASWPAPAVRRLDDAGAAAPALLLALAERDDLARVDAVANELLAQAVRAVERGGVLVLVGGRRVALDDDRVRGAAQRLRPCAGSDRLRGLGAAPRAVAGAALAPSRAARACPSRSRGASAGGALRARPACPDASARRSSSRSAFVRMSSVTSATTRWFTPGPACCPYDAPPIGGACAKRSLSCSVSRSTSRSPFRSKRNDIAELAPTPSFTSRQSSPEVLSTMAQPWRSTLPPLPTTTR